MEDKSEPKIRKRQVHQIIKKLSPISTVTSPKKGTRSIHRSVTPGGVAIATDYINGVLDALVQACERAMEEYNIKSNAYYKKFRYDEDIVRKAIKILKGGA